MQQEDEQEVNLIQIIVVISTSYLFIISIVTDITEGSVGKEIDIEYDSNDLSNVSMAVDGLNSRQFRSCWSLIVVGILFIVIYILMFFGVI